MMLSVIVPSIRTHNLIKLYNSIDIGSFEMIVVGPVMPLWWSNKMIFIESFRSPNASQQLALSQANGDYITSAADDGVFLPGALGRAIRLAEIATKETVIVGEYLEGDHPNPDMEEEEYYEFGYHKAYRLKGVPQDGLIFNCGIISRKFLLELGGWDCQFETTTCAHADLGIRAQKAGAKMILMDEVMFKCSHQPGKTGDHGPVHNAMVKRDLPRFQKLYAKPNNRINIPLDNWKNTPERWSERFK